MAALINLAIFLFLLALGYGVGRAVERRHYRRIIAREKELAPILLLHGKHAPENAEGGSLVYGSVVISIDYFKRVAAALKGIVGGRISAYESLLDRARREAILRMKTQAQSMGANAVVNVRMETASISKDDQKRLGTMEVVAYGSAIQFDPAAR